MVGKTLGHYEILAPLGEGGMGKVYLARDTQLDREVAIKVLPDDVASDQEHLARFEREAKLLASLNHANIAGIYGLDDADGVRFIAMERVEGTTLAEHIEASGGLEIAQALEIGRQIAEALEAAHDRGIIHRDLKPANVQITPEGNVKVLDFGLAKSREADGSSSHGLSHSPTMAAATEAGIILGTAAYMSPEQARGKPVDQRADIWAFGAVLYEMVTARKAFPGESLSDTMAAILKEEPDWNRVPESALPLRRILARCLTKESRQRYHHIADVRIAIEEYLEDPPASDDERVIRLRSGLAGRDKVVAAAAAVVLALLASVVTRVMAPQDVPWTVQSSILPPDQAVLEPNAGPVAISPDGRLLAFVARTGETERRLWVRPLESESAAPLPGTEEASWPFWSPDNRALGFFADGKLKRIDVAGGAAEVLGSAEAGNGGTWNEDGIILYSPGRWAEGIRRVSSSGQSGSSVTTIDRSRNEYVHIWPEFLPDGNHFLFVARTFSGELPKVYVSSLDGMEPRLLLSANSRVVYSAPGYLLYWRDGAVRAQRFDADALQLAGDPLLVASGVSFDAARGALFSASQNGVLAHLPGTRAALSRLIWFDRSGQQLDALGEPDNYFFPRVSHSGRRFVVDVSDLQDNGDLWLHDLSRPVPSRFTFDPANDSRPVWSPDDSRIVFSSTRGKNSNDLYQKPTGGVGEAELLFSDDVQMAPTDWSLDNRFIVYERLVGAHNDIWVLSVQDKTAAPFLETPFNERGAKFSPDGNWMMYVSDESGRPEIYARPFPGPGDTIRVSAQGGTMPTWNRDGRELFFIGPDRTLMRAGVELDPDPVIEVPEPLLVTAVKHGADMPAQYDVSADGQRFLINTLLEDDETLSITLIVNWLERLDSASRDSD